MLKSSKYYKNVANKIFRIGILPCVFVGVVAASVGSILWREKVNAVTREVMSPTGYYEYVEENTAIYDKMYQNGELTYQEHENRISELKNPEKYLNIIGDEETKTILKQTQIKYSLWYAVLFSVPIALSPTITLLCARGAFEKRAKRAEKIEAMRAETDSIKINYDPKHSDDDYDIKMI